MPDEPVVDTPVAEPTPPPEPIPAPPPESLDDRGVPWKNTVAELNRKLAESESARQQVTDLNQQYQVALGQQKNPAPAAPAPTSDLSEKFDDVTTQYIQQEARKIANEEATKVAYGMARGAELAKVLEDPDIRTEAVSEYNALKANPMYVGKDDMELQYLATNSARATVAERRLANPPDPNAPPPVEPASRVAASVPATRPSTVPDTPSDDPDADFKTFWSDPGRIKGNESWLRSCGYYKPMDINSDDIVTMPNGKIALKQLARNIYNRAVRDGIVVNNQVSRVEVIGDGR